MYSIRSKDRELNTYINSFIEKQYQPVKMFGWRIILLALFIVIAAIRDYQNYQLDFDSWFSWTPALAAVLCLLTLNFQSLYLGSMSYQYRHHDTPFQIARKFSQFEYDPLIDGLGHKLKYYQRTCKRIYFILFALPVSLQILVNSKIMLWQISFASKSHYIFLSIYIFLVLSLIAIALASSLFISLRKRQIELMALALFWLESASNLRYIDQST